MTCKFLLSKSHITVSTAVLRTRELSRTPFRLNFIILRLFKVVNRSGLFNCGPHVPPKELSCSPCTPSPDTVLSTAPAPATALDLQTPPPSLNFCFLPPSPVGRPEWLREPAAGALWRPGDSIQHKSASLVQWGMSAAC